LKNTDQPRNQKSNPIVVHNKGVIMQRNSRRKRVRKTNNNNNNNGNFLLDEYLRKLYHCTKARKMINLYKFSDILENVLTALHECMHVLFILQLKVYPCMHVINYKHEGKEPNYHR
jgi:hypothetical protein